MKFNAIENKILAYLNNEAPENGVTMNQLANTFNYRGSKNYKKLVRAVAFLEDQGEVEITPKGTVRLPNKRKEVEGVYRANEKGFGFITYDEQAPDLFVPHDQQNGAMDGDVVYARVIKEVDSTTGKGSEARVEKIVKRADTQLVGEFKAYPSSIQKETGNCGYIIPKGKFSKEMHVVALEDGLKPIDGTIVVLKIKTYPTKENPNLIEGHIVKEIGHKNEPGVDIISVLYDMGIPHVFPENVINEAKSLPQEVLESEMEGRVDLREQKIVTIDGPTAKDIDDAIYLERLTNGNYKLFVHIADVSHYVRENSPLDKEAYERGTSIYLADRVVPMLPKELSNGICSLNEGVDRLAMTCEMQITPKGAVVDYDFYESVIHSHARLTYDEVNLVFAGDNETRERLSEFVEMLDSMIMLHNGLETMRQNRGALSFEIPEASVILDDEGFPIDIEVRERGLGEKMIESFMLVANETVARHFKEQEVPFVYRVHENPDSEKMQRFAEFATSFGIILKGSAESIRPKDLQDMLDGIKGEDYEQVVSTVMLRSMKQAKYSNQPLGHYGLAASDYTHFTAPIRRYPDLLVHRLLKYYSKERPNEAEKTKLDDRLDEMTKQCSERERRAVDAERETVALKKAEYMSERIGEEYQGKICSITSFGFFVELPNTIEGLVSIQTLNDDYYHYNADHLLLIGERTGQVFRIGQSVKVEVIDVDIEQRNIDFKLLEASETDGYDVQESLEILRRSNNKKAGKNKKKSNNKNNQNKPKKSFKMRQRDSQKGNKKGKKKKRR